MAPVRAGLDEVGLGALAGPFIAVVAVFRDRDLLLLPHGVRDSKKTSEAQRETLYLPICNAAWDVGIGHAWPWEIDRMGPAEAIQLTYRRAVQDLRVEYDELIIDGNVGIRSFKNIYRPPKVITEPKADVRYQEVSAASIIAKKFRDDIMRSFSKRFPAFNWAKNKGYGTPDHEEAIKKNGLLVQDADFTNYVHRKSYCKKFMFEGIKHAIGV